MVATVSVETHGLEKRLERLYASLKRPTAANRAASVALYGWVIRNYDGEGSLIGGWAPLADSTEKRKARLGKERKLVISGAMRASILPFYDDENAGVGTPLTSTDGAPYPLFHQEGTEVMPARQFLPDRETTLGIGVQVYDTFVAIEIRRAQL